MGLGIVELLLLLLMGGGLLTVVLVVVALTAGSRAPVLYSSEVAAARRHATTTSVMAGLLSVGAPVTLLLVSGAVVVLGIGGMPFVVPAIGLACAPLLGAFAGIVVLLVGELTWPRPTGSSRTAVLRDRSVRDLVGGGWVRWAAVASGLAVVGLVAGGLVATDGGQSIEHTRGTYTQSAGPFPGWGYTLPQLIALAACVLLAAATVRAVASRSAVVTADTQTDDLLRAASVARVGRFLTAAALVTLGADLFFGGAAATRVYEGGGWHGLALACMVGGPFVLLLGLVTLALPVPRLADLPMAAMPPAPPVRA